VRAVGNSGASYSKNLNVEMGIKASCAMFIYVVIFRLCLHQTVVGAGGEQSPSLSAVTASWRETGGRI